MNFPPFKPLIGVLATTLTVTVLGFTHYQAFRLGRAVDHHPLVRTWQRMRGAPPSCSSEDQDNAPVPWLEELYDFWQTNPDS